MFAPLQHGNEDVSYAKAVHKTLDEFGKHYVHYSLLTELLGYANLGYEIRYYRNKNVD